MNKTRRQNKAAHTAEVHSVNMIEMHRVFISWLVGRIEGLDRDGSRKVSRIVDAFELENFEGVKPDERFNVNTYELSGYEIQFLLDQIEEVFKTKKCPPAYARYALEAEDILKEALNGEAEEEGTEPVEE